MKTLIFTSQFCHGAAELLAAELAVDLNNRGIPTDVMSMYSSEHEDAANARERLLKRGVPDVLFLGLKPHPSIVQVIQATLRLASVIRRGGYHIVETSSPTPSIIASWACWLSGCLHVCGLHFAYDTSEAFCLRHAAFLNSVRLFSNTRFYAISEFTKQCWHSYSGIEADRIATIYNSSLLRVTGDTSARDRVRGELGIAPTAKVAICVGRIAAYKRQDLVIEALSSVCRDDNLTIVFAGEPDLSVNGTSSMLARMEQTVSKLQLGSRVKFLGRRTDIEHLMLASDVLVHAPNKEAFGLVLVEALQLGLPVVATSVEGIPEVLRGSDSILVRPDDPVALRQAVLTIFRRSPETAARAAELGKRIAASFSQTRRSESMLKLFQGSLDEERSNYVSLHDRANG